MEPGTNSLAPDYTAYAAAATEIASNAAVNEPHVRWRRHEMILVAVIAVTALISYSLDWLSLRQHQLETDYVSIYSNNHISFNYFINVLLPKTGCIFLFYLAWLIINLLLIPSLKRICLKDSTEKVVKRSMLVVFLFVLLSELVALGVNLATYFAHPWFFNYGGFSNLAIFGYNEHPMTDLFFGFSRSTSLVTFFVLVAVVREIIINHIEKQNNRRGYRILITNQCTIIGLIYFSILAILMTIDTRLHKILFHVPIYFAPSVFLVFMSNTYWLFPSKGEKSFLHYSVLLRLLLSTFLCTYAFFAIDGGGVPNNKFLIFLLSWAVQLFLTTPLSWRIYLQRKEGILRMRGMEKDLEKSKADLQFLRSQINPHFLFNALNTLYGTALREKSADTAKGIQMLGDMMRFMLYENTQDFIPMQKEIEYLKNYISLQKLRIQESPEISIEENIDGQYCDHPIAPMLLIPFVENAFKHGISLEKRSWIKISLICDEKTIQFEVRNSLHPRDSNDPEKDHSGIGLRNVMKRLEVVYSGRYQVNVQKEEGEFYVHLVLRP